MIHTRSIACAAALLLIAGIPTPAPAQTESEVEVQVEVPAPPEEGSGTDVVGGATLYQRIGGYDEIAAVVDDFLQRMAEDDRLQGYLEPLSDDTMRSFRQDTVDFLCQEMGGPCFYTGRDMDEAHAGTGISAADWERATELMAASLDARGIQGELRDEIGTFLAGLREDIVEAE